MISNECLGKKDNIFSECLVCSTKTSLCQFFLPCECKICQDCVFDWIASKNFEVLYSNFQKLTCPNHICKKEITIDFLIKNFNKKNMQCLNEILFRKFMNSSQEFKNCPNKLCSYTGWVNIDKKCTKELECQLCGEKWIDPSIMSFAIIYQFYLSVINYRKTVSQELSELNVLLFSKPCSKCGIKIAKFAGCDSVSCTNCGTNFCYNCMQVHTGYRIFCDVKYFFTFFLFFLIVAFGVIKIFSSFYTLCIIVKLLTEFFTITTIAFVYIYSSFKLLNCAFNNNAFRNPTPLILRGVCFVIYLFFFIFIFGYLALNNEIFSYYMIYILIEILIISICGLIVAFIWIIFYGKPSVSLKNKLKNFILSI